MPECQQSIESEFPAIPSWLNKDYLKKILQSYRTDDTLQITKFKLVPAMKKGDGYASVMFRTIVEYSSSTNSETKKNIYLVKLPFEEDEFVNSRLSEFQIYDREMDMYNKFLPKQKSLLKSAGIDQHYFPETLHIDYTYKAILFEDLSVKSYKCADRLSGLDIIHAKMVLEKLARMHAASVKMNEMTPGIFKSCDRGLFNRHTNAFEPYYSSTIEICIKLISKWENWNYYVEKLRKLKPHLMEYTKRSFDVNENFFNVLIHGDLWTNNIMFKYNERNEPIDIIMIDFQYSCYASPAVDLNYFINTSLEENLRLKHQDELIQYYFYKLVDALKRLRYGGKIPTLVEFLSQFIQKSFYGFVAACLVQPIFLNEHTDDADFEALIGTGERSENFRRLLFENPNVQKKLKRIIPMYDRKGLLDVN